MGNKGFSGDWLDAFCELAQENIVPPFVTIQGVFDVSVPAPDGVTMIAETLSAVEKDADDGCSIEVTYLGAPRYRILVKAPDYKVAEEELKEAVDHVSTNIGKMKGNFGFKRKDFFQ